MCLAVNWNQWLGPSHNGSSDEITLSVAKVGTDYSSAMGERMLVWAGLLP